jgi:hypothetical protein
VGSLVQFSDVYSRVIIGRESMLTGANYNFGELILTNTVPGPQTGAQGVAVLFCACGDDRITINDPNPLDPMQVTLSLTPGSGILQLAMTSGVTITTGGNNTATVTFRGTTNAVNMVLTHVNFIPAPSFTGLTTLTVTSQELNKSGNPVPGVTATSTVAITITPINHPPTVAGPTTQATHKNVPLVFGPGHGNAITLGDPDVNPAVQIEQLTLSAEKGTLLLGTIAGLTFVSGNGTSTVVLRGTINALNAAINGLVFTPTPNYLGTAYLAVVLNDLGNTVGPPMESGRTVAISVT